MNKRIDRESLKLVIRRAAELYAAETEAEETLSETEVLRIGDELGLPTRLVKQALYEMPRPRTQHGWIHRLYGPGTVTGYRVVPGSAEQAFADLEDYLVTREYLQRRRARQTAAWFEPAGDAISNMARALRRPAGRFQIARSTRVILATHDLDQASAHVRLTLDLTDRHRSARMSGLVGGATLGAAAGFGTALAIASAIPPAVDVLGLIPALAAGTTAFSGVAVGIMAVTARRFRRRLERARIEVEGLLDRLERGGRLDPPPAPWWRRIQKHPVSGPGETHQHR